MDGFKNTDGKSVLLKMVTAIQDNKDYLGEVDGLIGDGDHGMNMNKGFSLFGERIKDKDVGFSEGLNELGMVLFNEIGGSMGPIYGTIFMSMADAGESKEIINLASFTVMLSDGLEALGEIVEARVGDKTLVDTLFPAVASLKVSLEEGDEFSEALEKMKAAAEAGKNSTKDMIARYGRSSRLGERSKGVLDAGAVSCSLILCAMADGIQEVLKGGR